MTDFIKSYADKCDTKDIAFRTGLIIGIIGTISMLAIIGIVDIFLKVIR